MKLNIFLKVAGGLSKISPSNLWIGFVLGFSLLLALLTASYFVSHANVRVVEKHVEISHIAARQTLLMNVIFQYLGRSQKSHDVTDFERVNVALNEYQSNHQTLNQRIDALPAFTKTGPILLVRDRQQDVARDFIFYTKYKIDKALGLSPSVMDLKKILADMKRMETETEIVTALSLDRANPLPYQTVTDHQFDNNFNGEPSAAKLTAAANWLEEQFVLRQQELENTLYNLQREQAEKVHLVEKGFYAASVALLLLEALFIFLPAHLVSSSYFKRSDSHRSRLEKLTQALQEKNKEIQMANARIHHDVMHDAQTGLANRRYLKEELQRRVHDPEGSKSMAVLHLDLDSFKHLNDTLGHKAGDRMLTEFADRLRAILDARDFIARVGGDEFVVLSDWLANEVDPCEKLTKIIDSLNKPVDIDGAQWNCRVSVGVDFVDLATAGKTVDISDFITNADIALYHVKEQGGGNFQIFNEQFKAAYVQKQALLDEIELGFEREEFVPFYQIQYDAKTREPVGAEALVRWAHPKRGILEPKDFLDEAIGAGYGPAIDQKIMVAAVEEFNVWKRLPNCPISHVAVNLHASSLEDPQFIEQIKKLSIDPAHLSFEITETVHVDQDAKQVIENVEMLKSMGYEIEIDDFGTGHASILSLQYLKPDRLKIDREFVQPIIDNPDQLLLVQSIIDLSRPFNVQVVAEGVESAEHAEILTNLGCDVLQGYALCEPIPSSSVLARFIKNNRESHRAGYGPAAFASI